MTAPSFEVYDAALPFAGLRYGPQRSRMAVIGLGGGRLLVVSPGGGLDDAAWGELAALGTPAWLLAPNHFHNAGIAAWKARFPEARVVAHPDAIPRLKRQVPGVEFDDVAELAAELPAEVRLLHPPGAKQGETWVSLVVGGERAWFVTDGLVNERKLSGAMGGMMWLLGFRARLMVNPMFKRLFLRDKAEFLRWTLAELDRDQPTRFVPAHGGVLEGPDTVAKLNAAILDG